MPFRPAAGESLPTAKPRAWVVRTDAEGVMPTGLTAGTDGALYGTTGAGGANGAGSVFRITDGEIETLYSFTRSGTISPQPTAPLTAGANGVLYGVTGFGGPAHNGTAFRCEPDGKVVAVYSFSKFDQDGNNPDGAEPESPLIAGRDGSLFGTTCYGGKNGAGTIFRLSPHMDFTALYSFPATSYESNPTGLLTGNDGYFYAVCTFVGSDHTGVIDRIDKTGNSRVLHVFSPGEGMHPTTSLVQDAAGNLYGTTTEGASGGRGAVYRIDPSGGCVVLKAFDKAGDSGINASGYAPTASLTPAADGAWYGTAERGGAAGAGTIFKIAKDGAFSVVHSFTGPEGAFPVGLLTAGPDGALYGVTALGGANDTGAVYRLTPTGEVTVVASFPNPHSAAR